MASLICTDVTIGHGPVTLAAGLTLTIAPGSVTGLVGPNGGGKTTLLRVLAGTMAPLAGRVAPMPAAATVGYLAQQVDVVSPSETVGDWLGRRTGVAAAEQAMEAAADAMSQGEPEGDHYGDCLDNWLALGGADFADRIPQALADVGLVHAARDAGLGDAGDGDLRNVIVSTLSGGQKARVGLAALMLARFDVFLLDEPTNDLDLAGLARLEQLVGEMRQSGAAIVVVSHDRTFLETVTTDVVELDPIEGRATVFGGGYTSYLHEREVARRHAAEAYEEYRDRHDDLLDRARTTRDWASKGVRKSRSDLRKKGMDPDKIGRKAKADASEKQAGKASRLEKAAERLEEVAEPRKVWELKYTIEAAPRSGSVVATIRDAVVERGSFRLGPVHLDLAYGERVAITGPNGAGKTTLLQMLLGRLQPTHGSAALGSGVVVGEVDQSGSNTPGTGTLVDSFLEWYPSATVAEIRTLLAKFGLSGDDVLRPAHSLSPGERTRAALARFQHDGVNLLVLDEPTNHLDLPAIEQLEAALDNYPGTLLLVSHDRRLLESVIVDRHWHVDAGRVSEGT
jgi:ATPase subunit of ABC transporter with duplicated ATPase domains